MTQVAKMSIKQITDTIDELDQELNKRRSAPQVTCYICKQTFQKYIPGAAHNRNYYRCAECLRS